MVVLENEVNVESEKDSANGTDDNDSALDTDSQFKSSYTVIVYENWIKMIDTDIINPKKEKLQIETMLNVENMINSIQNHFIKNYFLKLKPFLKKL